MVKPFSFVPSNSTMKKHLLPLLLLVQFSAGSQTVGIIQNSDTAFNGYTLFAPITGKTTYLIDNCGRIVNSWTSNFRPGLSAYLLNNGDLIRAEALGAAHPVYGSGGGAGGRIERIDWNGNLQWNYTYWDTEFVQHHDIVPLPNGNILLLAWERFTRQEMKALGRDTSKIAASGYVWSEYIVEVQPSGTNTGTIVWEWHFINHVIQDYDMAQQNYGNVSAHPELLDLNYTGLNVTQEWIHANSIDYNPTLDQILISSRLLGELYVIDHSTTTAEAATHVGGNSGKGGDLLYRWGNPEAYYHGNASDRILFGQHSAKWIFDTESAGKIMVFNNGQDRPQGDYSTVEIFTPQIDTNGAYKKNMSGKFLPDTSFWVYKATVPTDFFDNRISGGQELPNGNVLICSGTHGKFFEVTKQGNIVWQYINPVTQAGILSQGQTPSLFANSVFRTTRYAPNFSGFIGKTLTPGLPVELNPTSNNCIISSVKEVSTYTHFSVYPNPSSGNEVVVNTKEDFIGSEISLFDVSGKKLLAQKTEGTETMLRLQNFCDGIYFIQLEKNKTISVSKLVLAR